MAYALSRFVVQRFVDGATTFAVQYTRLAGQLSDARLSQGTAAQELPVRPERYEAILRFFLTPGCEELREPATRMIRAYRSMSQSIADDQEWKRHFDDFYLTLRVYEATVPRVPASGSYEWYDHPLSCGQWMMKRRRSRSVPRDPVRRHPGVVVMTGDAG